MKKNNSKKRFYVELNFIPKEYSLNGGISIKEVECCDPLLIEEQKDLIGFCFFEVDQWFSDDKSASFSVMGERTGMYYFGERVTLEALLKDADNDFIKKLQLDYLNRFGVEEAIFCENAGKVITSVNKNDRTIDEVRIERLNEEVNKVFINQKDFIEGLAMILEERKNHVDIVVSDEKIPICDCLTGEEVDNETDIVRKYDVYVSEYKLFSTMGIIHDDRLGLYDRDTYFRLSDAEKLASSLYQEFPYLEGAMNRLKLALARDREVDVIESITGKKQDEKKKTLK